VVNPVYVSNVEPDDANRNVALSGCKYPKSVIALNVNVKSFILSAPVADITTSGPTSLIVTVSDDGVNPEVGVGVGVPVLVGVLVGVSVGVSVLVGVTVGVEVLVSVGVLVGVSVGV
jgi:hypothetical protein